MVDPKRSNDDQQALIDDNDDPLPLASPPPVSMTSSQLQRQLLQDMETISVMSARSENNLSSISKLTLNTSAISAGTKSMNASLSHGMETQGFGQPPGYDEHYNDSDMPPTPSSGIFHKGKRDKTDLAETYKNEGDEKKPRKTGDDKKDLPQSVRIPKVSEQDRFIHCKVCHAFINVKNKLHQSVVRCSHCREATAIKAAPPGKQYVRCPCDCLLVCKSNSSRIMCPRANCNRTITIVKKPQPVSATGPTGKSSDTSTAQSHLTQASASKLSSNLSALQQQNSADQIQATGSAHSIASHGNQHAFDQVHSPYSERRRNPAYDSSNHSLDQVDHEYRGRQGGRKNSNGSSTAERLFTGNSAMSRENRRPHNPMSGPRLVRLQCAFCHMEFVRMTPLTSYGTCPHCEISMPFGNRYKRIRQWIFSLLAIVTLATALTLQLTKVLDQTGKNSQFNLMFIGLYVLTAVFIVIVVRYSCMKVTHISESEL